MNTKKSQVTLFIILGLVIVFAVLFLIYIKNINLFFQPSKVIPEDVEPIKNLIEQCLESEASPLIEHMMFYSGYPDLTQFTPNTYFPDMRVPYDLPKGPANNPRKEMEDSLKNKININLKNCIDFSKFEQFNIIEKKKNELTVKINDEDVTLSLIYPLEITNKQNNKQTKLLDFKKIIQTKLGKLSDLAREIMNKENLGIVNPIPNENINANINFLEEMTLDILRMNSPGMFPLEGMEMTIEKRRWSIENDLKKGLSDRIFANIDCITYQGTASNILPDSCLDPTGKEDYSKYYRKFSIPVTTDPKYKNTKLTTTLKYKDGKMFFTEFSVSPSKGDTVEPIKLFKSINPITNIITSPFKLYHHQYNIKYPILFSLYEDNDIFNFATEVTIKNNKADRKAEFFFTTPSISDELFCSNVEKDYIIKAVDEFTGNELDDVNIDYQCVQFRCEIGKTANKQLKAKLPFCYNGVLIANKENYLEKKEILSQENFVVEMTMTPLAKLDYNFIIMDGSNIRYELENGESVLIMLSNEQKNYEKQLYYSPEPELEKEKIDLLLGDYTYDTSIYLTKGDNIIGGFMNDKLRITTSDYDKEITFYIIADSGMQTDETIANFLNTLEEESKKYNPVITW